nr:hypothetical protein [uncultured Cohaesibacter sp.]
MTAWYFWGLYIVTFIVFVTIWGWLGLEIWFGIVVLLGLTLPLIARLLEQGS